MQLKTKEFKKMMWKKFNLLNWYVYFYVNVMVSVFSEPDWWNVKSDESSGDGNSSQENDSSVVYPNRKRSRLREIMYLRGLGRNLVHQKDRRQR